MDDGLQCSVCYMEYDTESRKPCIGKCGHSICFICASDERCETCPVCRRDGSFQEIIFNFGLMHIIDRDNKKQKKEERKREVEGICNFCKNEATQLSICIDCNLNDGILRMDYDQPQNEESVAVKWNTGNLSLEECIQQASFSSFCENCSTKGVHNGHRTIAFKKIQQTIFVNGLSGIKEEVEGFLNSYDQLNEGIVRNLEDYRKNISSLLDYVTQLTFDKYYNYPKRIMEFINNSNFLSIELTNCHQNITRSIGEFEKKLKMNYLSNDREELIHVFKDKRFNTVEMYTYNTMFNRMKMEIEIETPYQSCKIYYKNNIYMIGGEENRFRLKTMEVYNLNDKTRRKLASSKENRMNPTACIHNGKIIVGERRDYPNIIEEYDLEKNEWKILGRLDSSRNHKMVSMNNNLYVLRVYSHYLKIDKYNEKRSKFEEVFNYYSLRCANLKDCAAFNDKLFILIDEGDFNLYSSYIYNPSTKEFFKEERLKMFKLWLGTLYAANNRLYLIHYDSVKALDMKNYRWNLLWSRNE